MNPSQQAEAEKLKDRAYSRKEVVEIIRSVLGKIDSNTEPTAKLHQELSTLINYIDNMRTELAQIRSIEISHNHIPAASDELDAVVDETAKATGTIMDACEKIEKMAGEMDPPFSTGLSAAVTSVYEACGFQDITGQRITKVVKTLKSIESKITEILAAISQEPAPAKAAKEEKSLLNGPQLKGGGSTQEEIDKLLASFD
jgi:chemotaxis protein CheZ